MGEVSPCAAISLIAPCGPHGAIREIRRYPLCGGSPPQRPRNGVSPDQAAVHAFMRKAVRNAASVAVRRMCTGRQL